MALPAQPAPVKLVCGMISARAELFELATAEMVKHFGAVDLSSETFPFDLTHYYDQQMGSPLFRKFVSFERLADPGVLAEAKLLTNEIEAQFAATSATHNSVVRVSDASVGTDLQEHGRDARATRQEHGRDAHATQLARPINLDVGYVALSKLVLASMKPFSHRIYLRDGVYGEVTLLYRSARWEALEWTFPDFASGRYDAFLNEARRLLLAGPRRECEK
ncbi:MAG: DUF4416 family protein [Planctomycetaceae bacterium]|nr:DUF4416 family protein [Planctomycetaceae bacterium]